MNYSFDTVSHKIIECNEKIEEHEYEINLLKEEIYELKSVAIDFNEEISHYDYTIKNMRNWNCLS